MWRAIAERLIFLSDYPFENVAVPLHHNPALLLTLTTQRTSHTYLNSLSSMATAQEIKVAVSDAFAAQQRGDLDESKQLCDHSLVLLHALETSDDAPTESEAQLLRARIYNQLANISCVRGQHAEALDWYSQALAFAEKHQHAKLCVACLCNIGNVYDNLGDRKHAAEFQEQALVQARHEGLTLYQANILCNLAGYSLDRELYAEALALFQESLDLYSSLSDANGQALVLCNMASCYSMRDDYSSSVPLYTQAMEIAESIDDKNTIILVLDSLGQIYRTVEYAEFNLEKAESCLKKALEMSVDMKSLSNEAFCHKSLASLYSQIEDWKTAYQHFERFHDLMQETNSLEVKQMVEKFGYERQAAQREKEIELQKERSATTRALLHRVLPETIADRIMDGDPEIADFFPRVSILFADIKGFTNLSARMPAQIVVRMLAELFSEFDRIMKHHGCEKIKTIGDGYMAVAGAPIPCDDHALRLANAAREMLSSFRIPESAKEYIREDDAFNIRIGLQCGPVVAGVVGRDRFVYDVYSDAVNTASRMESHGIEGKIHCTEEFVENLSAFEHDFLISERGEIEVKGKGTLRTYFIK